MGCKKSAPARRRVTGLFSEYAFVVLTPETALRYVTLISIAQVRRGTGTGTIRLKNIAIHSVACELPAPNFRARSMFERLRYCLPPPAAKHLLSVFNEEIGYLSIKRSRNWMAGQFSSRGL